MTKQPASNQKIKDLKQKQPAARQTAAVKGGAASTKKPK